MKQAKQYTHGSSALKIKRAAYLREYAPESAELYVFEPKEQRSKLEYFASLSNLSNREVCIITAILCSVIALSVFLFDLQSHSVKNSLQSTPTKTLIVQSGDTLWSIAQNTKADNMNTSDMVNYLIESNHLDSSALGVGQTLAVPDLESN